MPLKIPKRTVICAVLLLAPAGVTSLAAQTACSRESGRASEAGWAAYRADSLELAGERFRRSVRLCRGNIDAAVGLGYLALRQARPAEADSLFRTVVARDSLNADGWDGLALAADRRGDRAEAARAARRALALDPGNAAARSLLDRLTPDWDRAVVREAPRPATLQVPARVHGESFEVASAAGWRRFYVQGVNFGVALPGRFPSEFPNDSARYAGWLDTLSAMRANALRVYTILPPAFYRALRGWNVTHPERAVWLVHGVWTELPPGDDFDDAVWKRSFRDEMQRVVDLLHGTAEIPARPGHASGRYDADVSPWTLGYIIGREWEPYSVKAFHARRAGAAREYRGRYLEATGAPPMDIWMAEQCDFLLAYEVDRYNTIRPIAYTNWPTLDPLTHPTEASSAEEAVWRRRSGRRAEAPRLEYENDATALDAMLVHATASNPAGWFASYHAYPYYPDFMLHDPGYQQARSSEGRSNFFGYLQELKRHHAGVPLLIAEYGVPSSRGIAHLQPQGWHHGGHDETAMAAIDARLTREIREAGAAGGIVFAWLDEWFKKNWIVIDFEVPQENTRRWHNVMDAEQNYGILGQYAGDAATTPALGGDGAPWLALPAIQESADASGFAPRALRAGADASYVYLALELGVAGAFPWDSLGLQIAIDTHRPLVGQHRLPLSELRSELGFEFLLDLSRPAAATLRVAPDYNRHATLRDAATGDDHGRLYRRPVTILNRNDGIFDSLFVITNRARFGRDGTFFPAQGYDRGLLRHGTERETSLADWYYDAAAGLVEVRIPWDLLNVTDPSSRTLLYEREPAGSFGTAPVESFHFGAVMYAKGAGERIAGALPVVQSGGWPAAAFRDWTWAPWTEPSSQARLKPVYDSLRAVWGTR
jgi:hypothetical protein